MPLNRKCLSKEGKVKHKGIYICNVCTAPCEKGKAHDHWVKRESGSDSLLASRSKTLILRESESLITSH